MARQMLQFAVIDKDFLFFFTSVVGAGGKAAVKRSERLSLLFSPPSSLVDFFFSSLTSGWDVGDFFRMHSTARRRLKTLAACWDFQFSQWFSPIKPWCCSFCEPKLKSVSD